MLLLSDYSKNKYKVYMPSHTPANIICSQWLRSIPINKSVQCCINIQKWNDMSCCSTNSTLQTVLYWLQICSNKDSTNRYPYFNFQYPWRGKPATRCTNKVNTVTKTFIAVSTWETAVFKKMKLKIHLLSYNTI